MYTVRTGGEDMPTVRAGGEDMPTVRAAGLHTWKSGCRIAWGFQVTGLTWKVT